MHTILDVDSCTLDIVWYYMHKNNPTDTSSQQRHAKSTYIHWGQVCETTDLCWDGSREFICSKVPALHTTSPWPMLNQDCMLTMSLAKSTAQAMLGLCPLVCCCLIEYYITIEGTYKASTHIEDIFVRLQSWVGMPPWNWFVVRSLHMHHNHQHSHYQATTKSEPWVSKYLDRLALANLVRYQACAIPGCDRVRVRVIEHVRCEDPILFARRLKAHEHTNSNWTRTLSLPTCLVPLTWCGDNAVCCKRSNASDKRAS